MVMTVYYLYMDIEFSLCFLHILRVLQVQVFLLAQILLRQLTIVFIIQVWLLSGGFAGFDVMFG